MPFPPANEHPPPINKQTAPRENLFRLPEDWHPVERDYELPPGSVPVESALLAHQLCPGFALVLFNEHELAQIELYENLDVAAHAAIGWLEKEFPSFPVGAVNLDTGELHRFILTATPLPAESRW